MAANDDDDEGGFGGLYDEGHWIWDDTLEGIIFIRKIEAKPIEDVPISQKAPTGTIEFRDDVDLIEQDVKDIAIFTAPLNILSPMLISMLHLSTTERFLKALILCCQYYLQVAAIMSKRMAELETRVRTSDCLIMESVFSENINDLRVLVAKEYCTMLIGGFDTKKFHHMGPAKKSQSLSNKDARLIETLIRISVQIVWLALGRRSFNQIELEVNRLFKSEIFNSCEHNLKTGYIAKMTKEERDTLLGTCLRHDKKLTTRSPLMNEVFCHRLIEFRLMGVGLIKYDTLTPRLRYFQQVISAPEESFTNYGISLGILGQVRAKFDTMLRPLMIGQPPKSKSSMSAKSTGSVKKCASTLPKIYEDIILPPKEETELVFPETFPDTPEVIRPSSREQLLRWQSRLYRLMHPSQNRMSVVQAEHIEGARRRASTRMSTCPKRHA